MNILRRTFWLLLTTAWLHAAQATEQRALLVYAAASLSNVLEELAPQFQQQTGMAVKFSFAASSTLARQIAAGAQADVFISADTEWADYLEKRKLLKTGTRSNLLGNRLVLIAPRDSKAQLKIAPGFALAAALGAGRLSIGDPESVPAGKYARAALTALGAWNDVSGKLVLGDSVRSTLAFVSQGNAPLGIVYETDALIDKNVRVVGVFPANTHPEIVYPLALTSVARPEATRFAVFLRSDNAQAIFKKYGFSVVVNRKPEGVNSRATREHTEANYKHGG